MSTTTISPLEARRRNIALLGLCRVCKRWKKLINSCPGLWNTIFLFTSSPRSRSSALVYLRRSKRTPLYFYISGGLSKVPPDRRGIAKGFKESLQMAATRAACLNLLNPDSALMEVWSAASHIREVMISGVVDTNVRFQGDTSSLQTIVTPLHLFSTPHPQNTLQQLTNLTLYQNSGRHRAQHLAEILGRTPQLRVLKIKNMVLEETSLSEVVRKVPVPVLERLELFACDRRITELLELPMQAPISVSFPAPSLEDCFAAGFVERSGARFLPVSFLRSATISLDVTARRLDGRTSVELKGRWATNGFHCNIFIRFSRDSSSGTRLAAFLLVLGIVRDLDSVVNLNIHMSAARLPIRLTEWLTGFSNLQDLRITGDYTSRVVEDVLRYDASLLPDLQSITLDQNISHPTLKGLEDWLAFREQAGFPVQRVFIPINVDAQSA